MTSADREQLKRTFDRDAELYDQARPGYPEQIFDDLLAFACLGPEAIVLEVGCGTGQASQALAQRGYRLVCRSSATNWLPLPAANSRRSLGSKWSRLLSNPGTHASWYSTWYLPHHRGIG